MKHLGNAWRGIVPNGNEALATRAKRVINKDKRLQAGLTSLYRVIKPNYGFNSKRYWERRYANGGSSGAGSYGRLAQYKAEFLNSFARERNVSSVIEFGSGDGAQLGLFEFKHYIGLDVSVTSIKRCIQQYADDESKSFYLYDAELTKDSHHLFTAELALSLDVIYHLVEDTVFEAYMRALFTAAESYVIIYSSNTSENTPIQAEHVRHRRFTDWVDEHEKDWMLIDHAVNKYSLKTNEIEESFADFYVYSRTSTEFPEVGLRSLDASRRTRPTG